MTKLETNTTSKCLNYYTELHDFPLFNWIKCTEGNTIYIRKEITPEIEENDDDLEAWSNMYDQYIKKYGLSKLYKKLLSIMKEKATLECTFVITRDRFKLTEIELKEEELKNAINNNSNGMTIEQALVHLSKWLGTWINTKEISVTEYYNILEEYGKANKKN